MHQKFKKNGKTITILYEKDAELKSKMAIFNLKDSNRLIEKPIWKEITKSEKEN